MAALEASSPSCVGSKRRLLFREKVHCNSNAPQRRHGGLSFPMQRIFILLHASFGRLSSYLPSRENSHVLAHACSCKRSSCRSRSYAAHRPMGAHRNHSRPEAVESSPSGSAGIRSRRIVSSKSVAMLRLVVSVASSVLVCRVETEDKGKTVTESKCI
jgi:hypothetical protein